MKSNYCPNCGAKIGGVCDCGVMILDFESKAEAVSAWNTRAGESE